MGAQRAAFSTIIFARLPLIFAVFASFAAVNFIMALVLSEKRQSFFDYICYVCRVLAPLAAFSGSVLFARNVYHALPAAVSSLAPILFTMMFAFELVVSVKDIIDTFHEKTETKLNKGLAILNCASNFFGLLAIALTLFLPMTFFVASPTLIVGLLFTASILRIFSTLNSARINGQFSLPPSLRDAPLLSLRGSSPSSLRGSSPSSLRAAPSSSLRGGVEAISAATATKDKIASPPLVVARNDEATATVVTSQTPAPQPQQQQQDQEQKTLPSRRSRWREFVEQMRIPQTGESPQRAYSASPPSSQALLLSRQSSLNAVRREIKKRSQSLGRSDNAHAANNNSLNNSSSK